MSKARKSCDSLHNFTPKDVSLPNKGNSEISKTVFTHVSNLHRLLHDWMKMIDKGTKICTLISELKLHEFNEGDYPNETKVLSESLVEALNGLKNVVGAIAILNNQLNALSRLQPDDTPVTQTWSVTKIFEHVTGLYSFIQREYKLKEAITENIAHCRDENVMEVYVSGWKYDVYFKIDSGEYLFAEFGLPMIV